MGRTFVFVALLVGLAGLLPRAESQVISGPLVVSDRWPECTNLRTWTEDVMRIEGVADASETTQGKAFFRWVRLFSRMATGGMIQAFEGPFAKEKFVTDAHKTLFVYGWGYCDTSSRIAESAWSEYKRDRSTAERVVVQHEDGGFHTMYRLRLDGHWGAFDPRYGYYLVDRDAPDARVLDWEEVGKDENILRNKAFKHRSAPFFEFFGREWDRAFLIEPAYFKDEESWRKAGEPIEHVLGNGQYEMGTPFHDMSFRLPKGTTIERFWDNSARKFYMPESARARREEPFLPAGRFYRVSETTFDGNWPKFDPNYEKAKPYLADVPADEGYNEQVRGGRTIGQAWGRFTYAPDLREPKFFEALTGDSDLVHSPMAPYLRAGERSGGGQAVFDFYSPYILVDGVLSGELMGAPGDARVELRSLQAKAFSGRDPDVWSDWRVLADKPGAFEVTLDRAKAAAGKPSLHGVYRFQVRVVVNPNAEAGVEAGLKALKLSSYFETGIMSIPQIFAGRNKIRFKVHDAAEVDGPIRVTYRYETSAGEQSHEKVLAARDFRDNEAAYEIDAPGLIRCKSLAISY